MRKLKLLLATLTLLVGGALSTSAASLPTSGSGDFLLRNVGTGTYLKGDSYWGTKAVVWNDPYILSISYVSEGVYTIKSQQNNGENKQYFSSGEDLYSDGDACNMTFTEVDAVNHYYTINNGTGNLYATEVTEDGATLYKVMAGAVSTDYAKWQVVSRDELVAALDAASSSNPVDATFFIKDAGIDVKSVNASGWTTKTNVDLGGGGNAGHSAESWNKANFNLSQTVTGLPNGKYRVTCHGFYRWNNGNDNNNNAAVAGHASGVEVLNAIFFAGTKETPLMSVAGDDDAKTFCNSMGWGDTPDSQWKAAACFTKGYYLNTINDVVVTDGTLEIGVKKTTQAGTDWAVFDEFKLYYLGEDISIYETPLADAKTTATSVDQSAPMNATILSELKSAISTYGSKDFAAYTSVSEITTAISALNTAATNATSSIENYAAALTVLNAASTLDAAGKANYAANNTVAAIQSAYDANTFEKLTSEQTTACAEALRTAAKAQTTEGADMTLAINNWDFLNCAKNSFPGWSIASTVGSTQHLGATCVEYWHGKAADGNFDYYQTITGLPIGKYTIKASMWNSENSEGAGGSVDGTAGVYGTSNGITVFKGVTAESTNTSMVEGTTDEIEVVDGTLRLGVKNNGTMGARWFGVDWIKLTYKEALPAADAADYSALDDAITAAETKTLGFEAGEYAPYINVAALEALAAAKAIDKTASNAKSFVTAATTALTGATWTANTAQMNAFYCGDLSEYAEDNASPLDYTPKGWTASANMRMMLKDATTYPGLADASATTAMMSWSGGITYGETAGYEMPLAGHTIYELKLKAAGWNNETRSGITVSVLNNTDGMAAINLGTPDRDIKGNGENTAGMTSYSILFATGAAGNYVFHVQSGNNMVLTDFELKKAASQELEFADNAAMPKYAPGTYPAVKITRTLTANKWATAVYPFAVSGVDNIAVLDSYDASTGALGFTSAAASTANVPFLMRSTAGASEISLSNVDVAAAAATDATKATKGDASLKGVYASTDITSAEKNYVLSNNTIYSVGAAGATIPAYRAYIQLADAAPARLTFTVDGETTAIEGITANEGNEGTVYNLQGQRVTKAQKGLYIQNGRKVLVK